jgi:diacylglycerol O-acyltransferase / wax synthase
VSGNDILAALLDLSPEGRKLPEPPPRRTERQPSAVELLARSAVSLTRHPLRAARLSAGLLRSAPALVANPAWPRLPLVDRLLGRDGEAILSRPGLRAPPTPFNRSITQHRRWGFCDLPLPEVKRVKNTLGVTVNDVVMALCAGALRRWLVDHDALPDGPLIAAVPVSVRTEEQQSTHGNRVSAMLAVLPTQLADPRGRLRAVHQAMRAAKEQHDALPANLLADVTQFAMPALAGQAARMAARLRLVERANLFNLIVSNVPGPNVPLYYAGAELLAYYPLSAIVDGQGLNITAMSYRDRLFFGVIACRELVPDVDRLTAYLEEELRVLTQSPDRAATRRGKPRTRR